MASKVVHLSWVLHDSRMSCNPPIRQGLPICIRILVITSVFPLLRFWIALRMGGVRKVSRGVWCPHTSHFRSSSAKYVPNMSSKLSSMPGLALIDVTPFPRRFSRLTCSSSCVASPRFFSVCYYGSCGWHASIGRTICCEFHICLLAIETMVILDREPLATILHSSQIIFSGCCYSKICCCV
jgi:hypothetical protein